MQTIYAILIYWHLICPCTYDKPVMDQIIADNQVLIDNTINDTELTNNIVEEYGDEANQVIVIGDLPTGD